MIKIQKHNVVIVGAGPAGISLAYLLTKSNIDCCIIDKFIFPRQKLCGGLVTKKTDKILKEIFEFDSYPIEYLTNEVTLYYKNNLSMNLNIKDELRLVDRKIFDNHLMTELKKVNCKIIEGDPVIKIDSINKKISTKNGIEIQYDLLVGADGANSLVRKCIDREYRPDALCLESYSPNIQNSVNIYFSEVNKGYAWIFPNKSKSIVGIGGEVSKNEDLIKAFKKFSNRTDLDLKGAYVPFGSYVKQPIKNNIILIGDAAGLANPITGEGLYYAFLSAKLAYESILKNNIEIEYIKKVSKIQKKIDLDRNLSKLVFNDSIQKVLFTIIKPSKLLQGLLNLFLSY